jgi:hypothetical protein
VSGTIIADEFSVHRQKRHEVAARDAGRDSGKGEGEGEGEGKG